LVHCLERKKTLICVYYIITTMLKSAICFLRLYTILVQTEDTSVCFLGDNFPVTP